MKSVQHGVKPQPETIDEDYDDGNIGQLNGLKPDVMDSSQMTFESFQSKQISKKRERSLKLEFLKELANIRAGNPSPAWSASSVSSICGDNSDCSFAAPSLNSSRVGSEVVSSSMNLRNMVLRKTDVANRFQTISMDKNESPMDKKSISDAAAMPPPTTTSIRHNHSKSKSPIRKMNATKDTYVQSSTCYMPVTPTFNECDTQVCDTSAGANSTCAESYPEDNTVQGTESFTDRKGAAMQRSRVFSKWRVILNDRGQLLIKGTIENGTVARSKPVVKSISPMIVESNMKYTYYLQGNIFDQRHELPDYVRGKFYNGFPDDWKNVHQLWQTYVAQGCNPNFRWPTPLADSDDDLKSDITEIIMLPNRYKMKSGSLRKPKAISLQTTSRNELNHSDASALDITTNLISSKKNLKENASMDRTYELIADNSSSKNQSVLSERSNDKCCSNKQPAKAIGSMTIPDTKVYRNKLQTLIPENNLEIIARKLAEKNCSPECIDKLLDAIVSLDCVIGNDSLQEKETKTLPDIKQYDDPSKHVKSNRKRRWPHHGYTTNSESETDGAHEVRQRRRKLVLRKPSTAGLECRRNSRNEPNRSNPMLNSEKCQPSQARSLQSQNSNSTNKSVSCKPRILQDLTITRGRAHTSFLHATTSSTRNQQINVSTKLSDSCVSLTEDERDISLIPNDVEEKDGRNTRRERMNRKCFKKHSSSFAYMSSSDYSDDGRGIPIQSTFPSSERVLHASAEYEEAMHSSDFKTSNVPTHTDMHPPEVTEHNRKSRLLYKTKGEKAFQPYINVNAHTSTHHSNAKLQGKTKNENEFALSQRPISGTKLVPYDSEDEERSLESHSNVDSLDIRYHKNTTASDKTENENRVTIPQEKTMHTSAGMKYANPEQISVQQSSFNVTTSSVRNQRNAKIQTGTTRMNHNRGEVLVKESPGSHANFTKAEISQSNFKRRSTKLSRGKETIDSPLGSIAQTELTERSTRRKGLKSDSERSNEKVQSEDNIHDRNARIDRDSNELQRKVSLGSDCSFTEAEIIHPQSDTKQRSRELRGRKVPIDTLDSVAQNVSQGSKSMLESCTKRKGLRNEAGTSNEKKRSKHESLGSESNPMLLTAWTPFVVCSSDSEYHLIFRGKLLNMMGHVTGRRHETDFIQRRISSKMVQTINNEFYELSGELNNTKQDVPKELVQRFRNGCPMRIHQLCKLWMAIKARENSAERVENEGNITMDKLSISMSSRGRRRLPPLNYWEGERIGLKGDELVYSSGVSQISSQGSSLDVSRVSHALPQNTSSGNTAIQSRRKNSIGKVKGTEETDDDCSPVKKAHSSTRRKILNELKDNCIDHQKGNMDNTIASTGARSKTSVRKLTAKRIEFSSSDDERSSRVLRSVKKKVEKLDINPIEIKEINSEYLENQSPIDGRQNSALGKRKKGGAAASSPQLFHKSPTICRVVTRQASSANTRDSCIRYAYYKNVQKEKDLLSEDSEFSRV